MNDIVSELCELPTGVYSLEFLPWHEISAWNGSVPVPINKWYGIGVYKNTLSFAQPTEDTPHGNLTSVSVACLVVNDSQEISDQLDAMGQMRLVLRVAHYDGKRRIVGTREEFVKLSTSTFDPVEIVGAQGYKLNFTGSFTKRPVVIA
ncbi:MAG: hypothetical protein ABIN80_22965 [Dyadobacter sp.]|uniref:hypothetical protein n=1 Tax=Dyadobacter sp. TaxID=1914288 RepID=UPI003267E6D2